MGETREEDMISDLPEDLLVSILKRVPIKDAVATMILSKRWRFILTMMPKVLEYKDSYDYDTMMPIFSYKDIDDDDDKSKSKKSVWWLLDKSMQLHKAPGLDILLMKLGSRCPSNADVGMWIEKAVDRGVVVLELDLHWWSVVQTSLPKTLYLCESLKTLILSHKIFVDVPPTACLPSLTALELNHVLYKNEDSLINLLESCPILESLLVRRKKYDNVRKFTVKSPCLLNLWYESSNDVEEEEDTSRCLVIDAPALTKFDFCVRSGETCSIENQQSCFEKVYIRSLVGWSFPDTDKFLRSFSTVSSLVLGLSEEMVACCGTIKFPRLIDCTIFPLNTDWTDSLVSFLQNTPKLKSFTVNYRDTYNPPIASMSWSESSYDPECLSSSLEKFELVCYGRRQEQRELVEYILMNAKCLKTATISMISPFTLANKKTMNTMKEELITIPRVSKTSKLLFNTCSPFFGYL